MSVRDFIDSSNLFEHPPKAETQQNYKFINFSRNMKSRINFDPEARALTNQKFGNY